MIKVLELFGGIGAFSKALDRLGIKYEIADYVEIDKYAVASYNAMHNTNFEPQDICNWDKDMDVDVIMHGSPCQDFSLAGKQAGGDEGSGTRSSLMYETIRIVEKLKPKYVIWENVKNVVSKKHIHNFSNYVHRLEELGYKSYYKILNAKDYGIPQNRERVFTISIRDDITIDKTVKPSVAVNFEREKENIIKSDKEIYQCKCKSGWQDNKVGLKVSPTIRANNNNTFILEDNRHFEFPKQKPLTKKLKDMLEETVDEKYYLSDKMLDYCMGVNQRESKFPRGERFLQSLNMTNNKGIATTISTNAGNRPVDNFIIDNRNMKEKLCDKLIEENKVKEYDVIRHSYSSSRMKEWETRSIEKNNEAPTLDTRCDCLGVVQKMRIRKLTPKECWRLMGFDDEDYEKASKVNSNAQLYKQAGNSIVVNVLEEIIKQLLKGEIK